MPKKQPEPEYAKHDAYEQVLNVLRKHAPKPVRIDELAEATKLDLPLVVGAGLVMEVRRLAHQLPSHFFCLPEHRGEAMSCLRKVPSSAVFPTWERRMKLQTPTGETPKA